MGANKVMEGQPSELALRVVDRLKAMKMNKAELAMQLNVSRPMVSQYLSGKYPSNPDGIEKMLREFLAETEAQFGTGEEPVEVQEEAAEEAPETIPAKISTFQSEDYLSVISVCQSSQEDMGLGIIVGRSGFGKTHALKSYARLPKVAYLECDDTMSSRDLVEALEQALGMVKSTGGTIWKRVSRIREFLNVNTGYLLIIDEADKLMNKYTAAKIEIIRSIFDQADVGIVIAGEPRLEPSIKNQLPRFANRVDFYYKLRGLNTAELKRYMEGWDMTEEAGAELAERACGSRNGCFRLLDRTMNNVRRVLSDKGETKLTAEVVREASGMMML